MKIVFAGTPEAAVPTLQAVIDSSHEVLAVFTQPDRPAGRGRVLKASPVKECALAHDLPVFQPLKMDAQAQAQLKELNPDLMIVVAYGLLLPKSVLDIPKRGCVNLHFSLLPRWRGAAPIQYTLLHGDELTGVTVMQMDEGLDTGPILMQEKYPVDPSETSQMLHDRLASSGAALLLETLSALEKNSLSPQAQNNSHATYASKIKKSEGKISWARPAIEIVNQIRAFNPWPVAFTYFNQQSLRIWEAELVNVDADVPPGVVMSADKYGIEVAAKDKVVRLISLQLPGGRRMSAGDFLNAHTVLPGETEFLELEG